MRNKGLKPESKLPSLEKEGSVHNSRRKGRQGVRRQLDRMTQQNAALVEESAAAAESLKDQAMRLSEVVASFRLS